MLRPTKKNMLDFKSESVVDVHPTTVFCNFIETGLIHEIFYLQTHTYRDMSKTTRRLQNK